MKTATVALQTLLASGAPFFTADLFTFTLVGGLTVRLTSADVNITVNGFQFTAARIRRNAIRTVVGVQVDSLDIELMTTEGDNPAGNPFIDQLNLGGLDGGFVKVERVFMPTFGDTSAGTIVLFAGTVSDTKFGRSMSTITVKSPLELLNIQMPRNVYQAACIHTVYDGGCTLLKANFTYGNAAAVGSTQSSIVTTLAQADGYFALGTLLWTSGRNVGTTYTVKTHASKVLTPIRPFLSPVATGDAFNVTAGCDKQLATCTQKFANQLHFRGYPYVPPPETAY